MVVERWIRLGDYFMPHMRLLLALLCSVAALMLALRVNPLAALPLVGAVLLVWDYFRNSGVWIGFRAFRGGNLPRVRRTVEAVRWPALLSGRSRAYFHWLKGVIEAADGRYQAARVHLLLSAAGALRTENDRSLVQCLLAEMALQENDIDRARDHVQMANALAHHATVARIIQSLLSRLERGARQG